MKYYLWWARWWWFLAGWGILILGILLWNLLNPAQAFPGLDLAWGVYMGIIFSSYLFWRCKFFEWFPIYFYAFLMAVAVLRCNSLGKDMEEKRRQVEEQGRILQGGKPPHDRG